MDYSAIQERYENDALTEDDLDAIADVGVDYVRSILECFGEGSSAIDEYEGDEGELILNVTGGDLAILIGRHGRCLEAFQQLVSSMMSRTLGFHYPVVVDIEQYRSRRREKVMAMAKKAAERVRRHGTEVSLSPMNAYERRLVHIALRDDPSVITHSEGEDPDRYVIVTLVEDPAEHH